MTSILVFPESQLKQVIKSISKHVLFILIKRLLLKMLSLPVIHKINKLSNLNLITYCFHTYYLISCPSMIGTLIYTSLQLYLMHKFIIEKKTKNGASNYRFAQVTKELMIHNDLANS